MRLWAKPYPARSRNKKGGKTRERREKGARSETREKSSYVGREFGVYNVLLSIINKFGEFFKFIVWDIYFDLTICRL